MVLDIFILFALGAGSGILAGLLGIGGGVIVVPSLLFYFQMRHVEMEGKMELAVATCLASMVLTTFSSSWSHFRKRRIDFESLLFVGTGNFFGAFLGAYLADYIPEKWLKISFGLFECGAALWLFYRPTHFTSALPIRRKKYLLSIAGFLVATCATLLGIGGGIIQVPLLIWSGLSMKRAIGTASALNFLIAWTSSSFLLFLDKESHSIPWTIGSIYLPAFLSIGIGAMATASLGAHLVSCISVSFLQKVFSCVLFLVGIALILSSMQDIFSSSLLRNH